MRVEGTAHLLTPTSPSVRQCGSGRLVVPTFQRQPWGWSSYWCCRCPCTSERKTCIACCVCCAASSAALAADSHQGGSGELEVCVDEEWVIGLYMSVCNIEQITYHTNPPVAVGRTTDEQEPRVDREG